MAKQKTARRDDEREQRIQMEIVVDAYDSDERAMGWYNYVEQNLLFPFTALCIAKRAISPLQIKDEVEVSDIAPENECRGEIFVKMRWEKDGLCVPLSQLKPSKSADEQTKQVVEDWHYWVKMGYRF